MKILQVKRLNCTISILVADFKKKALYRYFFQISPKKPWILPKVEKNFNNLSFDLYGWIIFYCGKEYVGVLYETNNDTILKDYNGNKYYLFKLDTYEEKVRIKKYLKSKRSFEVRSEDEEVTLVLYSR